MDIKKKKVLFVDLDGTLITTSSGNTFAQDVTDFRVRKDVLDRIRELNVSRVAIVTNQGGIPQHISEDDFIAKLKTIEYFVFTYCKIAVSSHYCSSLDNEDPRRKPNTGMMEEVMDTLPRSLCNKEQMLMIGDASGNGAWSDSDLMTARNFGIDYMDVNDFVKCL